MTTPFWRREIGPDPTSAQLEALRNELEAYKNENKTLTEQLQALNIQTDELKGEIERLKAAALPPAPAPVESPAPTAVTETPAPTVDLKPMLDRLNAIENLLADDKRKDDLIKDLHSSLKENMGDAREQLSRPFLKNFIRVFERLNSTFASCSTPEATADPEALAKTLKKMKADLLMITDMLEDEYNLEYFLPAKGDKYDPRLHNATGAVIAPSPELAGTVMECRSGGFRDTANGRIFKTAIVKIYKAN